MTKRYRHGAGFADTRRCFRPLDRNAKARLLYIAEAIEHRTKGKGCRQGGLGHIGVNGSEFARWGFHPLESTAFARRTRKRKFKYFQVNPAFTPKADMISFAQR